MEDPQLIIKNLAETLHTLINTNSWLWTTGPDSIFNKIVRLYDLASSLVRVDPFALDLDGDGIEITSIADGVYFDIDKSSFKEKTAWIKGDDGLLALDRNSNGIIDDGGELFGDQTLLQNGILAKNAFEAIEEFDLNKDKVIDRNDEIFNSLRVWRDIDSDGITDDGELFTLNNLAVKSIGLDSKTIGKDDGKGNIISRGSTFEREDGTIGTTSELLLGRDTVNSQAYDILITDEINMLPEILGSGNIHSLRQAMQLDKTNELKNLVIEFSNEKKLEKREILLDKIIYKWTETEGIDKNSRGSYMNGRNLAVLEKFMGKNYIGNDGKNPNNSAGPVLQNSYFTLREKIYVQLVNQTALKNVMGEVIQALIYNNDNTIPDYVESAKNLIKIFDEKFVGSSEYGKDYIADVIRTLRGQGLIKYVSIDTIRNHYLTNNIEIAYIIDAAGRASFTGDDYGQTLSGNNAENAIVGKAGNDGLYGYGGDDYIYGGDGNDNLNSGEGNDFVHGGTGDDTLYGENGNDILIGSVGNDTLNGGAGKDIYVFYKGDGQDRIIETNSATDFNKILFKEGIYKDDLIFTREGLNLVIKIKNTADFITAENYFKDGANTIEAIELDNGEILTNSYIKEFLKKSSDGDDIVYGGNSDDVLVGMKGNDKIFGYDGNDIIEGSEGADYLEGSVGSDTYIFKKGFGNDIILDLDKDKNNVDTISFDEGINKEDVKLQRDEDNLIIRHGTDSITVKGYFIQSGYNIIEKITFNDGIQWNVDYVKNVVGQTTDGDDKVIGYEYDDVIDGKTGNDIIYARQGNDILSGGNGDDIIYGEEGNDILIGGKGNDILNGGDGNNIIKFNKGDGVDTIIVKEVNSNYDSYSNTIKLGVGISSITSKIRRAGNDIILELDDSDNIIIKDWYLGGAVDKIVFDDGTEWLKDDIHKTGLNVYLDKGSVIDGVNVEEDIIHGSNYNDTISGLSGNDKLYGNGGADTLYGGIGDDYLEGGKDNDILDGGIGNNIFKYNKGDGNDTINLVTETNKINYDFGYVATTDWSGTNWGDGGRDCFDGFGQTSITVNGTTVSSINFGAADGVARKLKVGESTFETKATYLHTNLLELNVKVMGNENFNITTSGNMGSDGNENYTEGFMSIKGSKVKYAYSKDRGGDPGMFFVMLPSNLSTNGSYSRSGDNISGTVNNATGEIKVLIATGYKTAEEIAGVLEAQLFSSNILKLGEGISESDVSVTREGFNLIITLKSISDRITISDWFNGKSLNEIKFFDGKTWSNSNIESKVQESQVSLSSAFMSNTSSMATDIMLENEANKMIDIMSEGNKGNVMLQQSFNNTNFNIEKSYSDILVTEINNL